MAITPVQSVITPNAGTTGSGVASFNSPAMTAITAGNTIVGAFTFVNAASLDTMGTIVDDKGNVYNKSTVLRNATDNNCFVLFHLENIPAGGPTIITANDDGTNLISFNRFVITEFSGVATASALDVGFGGPTISSNVVGTATFSSADVTTLVNGDLIYCAAIQTNAATGISAGGNYSSLVYGANNDTVPMRGEYRIQTSAGSVNTGNAQFAGISGTNNYTAGMIPLKAVAVAAGGKTSRSLLMGVGQSIIPVISADELAAAVGIYAAKKLTENPEVTRRSVFLPRGWMK